MTLLLAMSLLGAPAHAESPGVVGELEQAGETTHKQKAEFVSAALQEIEAGVSTVTKLLETARNAKQPDKEEITCLEEKLPQLKTILEVAKKTNTAMESHLAASDMVHADQEYRQVAVLLTRAREFIADAQQCVKGAAASAGKTSSSVSQDESGVTIDDTLDVQIDDVPGPSPV